MKKKSKVIKIVIILLVIILIVIGVIFVIKTNLYNNDETKYLDKEGKELKNTDVYPNNSIFASKNEQGKWGFVDKSGNIVIDYQYDRVTEVDEYGYAGIKQDGKWGVIDNQGKVVVEPTFDLQEEIDPIFMGVYHKVNYGFGEFYFEDLRV